MKFVDMDAKDLRFLIYKSKQKMNFKKLDDVAKYLKISRPMLFNYLSKKYLLPADIFLILYTKTNFNKNKLKFKVIEKKKFLKHKIKLPELSEDLAEVIGALNGDGHISENLCDISITGHRFLDSSYLDYLSRKFNKLFNMNPKKSFTDHFSRIRIYSKEIGLFLIKKFKLPRGKKKGNLNIPKNITANKEFFLSYLRGIFDTDGTFYIRRKKEPVVEISSADVNFLKQLKEHLSKHFSGVGIGGHRVFIYNKNEIIKFFGIVQPANSKHLNKYKEYLKTCAGGPVVKTIAFHD